jgi:tetratricopeptide (TPR) repeat protein
MALLHLETALAHYQRNDGRAMGYHLEWSRRIVRQDLPWPTLDHLRVPAIGSQFVSEWALTAAGFFHTKLALAEARRFLDEELENDPASPVLLLARGMTEEIAASERALPRRDFSSGPPPAGATRVGIARPQIVNRRRSTLLRAADLYRAALTADPSLHSARLRLGRVQFELNNDEDALLDLERTLTQADDAATQYLANLFLAAVHERNERTAEATRYFDAAAAIFPSAQAPYLGLSRLELSHDPAKASRTLEQMFGRAVAASDAGVSDPWWLYDAGFGASFANRLSTLREEVSRQ